MKRRLGLALRMTLVFILFASALLAGIIFMSYGSGRDALQAAAISELLSSALGKEAEINHWLAERISDVNTIGQSPTLLHALNTLATAPPQSETARLAHARAIGELKPYTEALARTHRVLAIADPATGKFIAATDAAVEGQSAADEPYFFNGKNGPYVQNPHNSSVVHAQVIAIGTPLRSAQGVLVGVLVGWLDLAGMNNIVQQRSGLHYSDDAYLVNPAYEFVTQPRFRTESVVLREKVRTEAVIRCLAGNSGIAYSRDYRGVPSITVYRWLPQHKLGLIAKIDHKEAFLLVRDFGAAITLFSVVALLAASGMAVALAHSITRPLLALQARVARFGRGELNVRLRTDSKDELGQLAEEFNNMASAISEKETQLKTNAAQLEERVRERTQVLQRQANMLNLAHDAIIVRETSGTIRFWNRGAEEMYGFTNDQAIDHNLDALLQTKFPISPGAIVTVLLKTGRWEGELIQTRRDRKPIVVASRETLQYGEHGQLPVVLVINTDITERKQAQVELESAKEAAEAASRAKSEFLANMSHEIRTPMNGVIGLTNIVLKTRLSEQQHEYLTLIKSSANSLLRLLNDILDFSKMEARKLELDIVQFDVREAIGDALKAFSASANEKGLELTYQVASNVPVWLLGDPGRLTQVVVNLVGNALKFTERGEVALKVVQESRENAAAMLRFSISDTGIGIPKEKQAHIFDSFAQADSSTTRHYGGTGLGLAIASQLVALMDGKIWADSEPGKGTTFHFTVRLGLPPQRPVAATLRHPAALKNMPVLVVDDNRTNRLILGEILAGWDMRPVLAEHGEQALAELQRNAAQGIPFPLVLVDSQMPQFDGFQLAEKIKSTPALNITTIMMLSSSDASGEIARCKALGVTRFLRTPIKQSELFDAIVAATALASGEKSRKSDDMPAFSSKPSRVLKVLVAEDHPVNQKLVTEILRARGHSFSIAHNGFEALEKLEQEQFDVILMDGQMPELDGYQATREIRRREQVTGKHIRIIAVTAHAMKDDREVCLAAGMDDYVSKPIDPDLFLERLEAEPGSAIDPASESRTPEVLVKARGKTFDADSALKRARGKQAFLKQLIYVFMQDLPNALTEIHAAVTDNDPQRIERAAHRLRGAAITLSADGLAQTAEELGHIARNNRLDQLPQTVQELDARAVELVAELNVFLENIR